MRKFFFPAMIGLSALGLAAIAASFSVIGMASIFPGWTTVLMMAAIEAGKLVSVSVLYRMWKQLSWLKWLLIPMTIIIMMITSIGIYGHLSSAYEGTASDMRTHESQVQLEDQRKDGIREKIKACENAIGRKQVRAGSLVELRTKQEVRLDSLYARNQLRSAKEVQASIVQADKEIASLNEQSDSLNAVIDAAMVEISALDSTVIKMESSVSGGEAGTIRFISRATGITTDSAANVLMLLIIFVFDPLSILLLIVFNMAMVYVPKKEEEVPVVVPVESPKQEEIEDEDPTEEPIEPVIYSSNADGEFVKEPLPIDKKITPAEDLNSRLLFVLFQNGKLSENDHLDLYPELVQKISDANIPCTKKQIDKFLELCVDLGIIRIGKHERVALKSYSDALEAIGDQALSKA